MATAIREFITDPATGKIATQFTDIETGRQLALNEILDYQIVARNELGSVNPVNQGLNIPRSGAEPEVTPPVAAPQPIQTPVSTPVGEEVLRRGAGNEVSDNFSKAPRTQASNFGYVDKPGLLSAASMIPGPIGMAGQVVNGVVNGNNVGAVSAARTSMGLPGTSGFGIAKGVMSDNNGQVADVSINDRNYSVGLEAENAAGQTTLTPNEARNRGLTLGGMTELTSEQSAAMTPQKKGVLGRVVDGVKTTLGIETSAPLANTSTPASVASTPQAAPSVEVDRQSLAPVKTGVLGRPVTGVAAPARVDNTPVSANVPNAANPLSPVKTGLLGRPSTPATPTTVANNKPVPSFAEVTKERTAIPSVPRSAFSPTAFSNAPRQDLEDRVPGLAGIVSKQPSLTANSKTMDGLDKSIIGAVAAVSGVVGDVKLNSGYRSPEANKKAQGVKNSQHMNGKAVDIDTTGWTDTQKRDAAEAAAQKGVKGIGIGFSDTMMHIDTRENPASWGYRNGKAVSRAIKDQPSWAQKTLTDIKDAGPFQVGPLAGPTPKSRPSYSPEAVEAPNTPVAVSKGIAAPKSRLGGIVNEDVSKLSAGRLATAGVPAGLSDQDIRNASFAISGELSGKTLRGIARRDPEALNELSTITATVMNRAQQIGVDKTLTPNTYNSLSRQPIKGRVPMNDTKANWNKYGGVVESAVRDTVEGKLASSLPDATHYANRDVSYAKDKSYYSDMGDVAKIGPHTFGSITSEFDSKKTAAAKKQVDNARVAQSAYSDYSGVARAEQKADRKVADTSKAPKTGLGTKSSATKSAPSKSTGNEDRDTRATKDSKSSSSTSSKSGGKGLGSPSSSSKSSGSMGPSSRGSTGSSSKSDSKSDSKGSSKSGSGGGKSSKK